MKFIKYYILIVFLTLAISCKKEFSCFDGILNGNEIGIDCGGECPVCFSCTDGIQNGDETGIDCGGDCLQCPTCFDGILNQNETDIDCGGNCSDCEDLTISIVGVWKITSHTIAETDILSSLAIDDVYHEYYSNNSFVGLTVQDNQSKKKLYGDSYTINSNSTSIVRISGNFSQMFTSLLTTNTLELRHINSDNQLEIQKFNKVLTDLCQGVNCNSQTCHYGYCL